MRTSTLLVVALCAIYSAHARDLPSGEATAYVGGFSTPVEMALSPAFLARAGAAAVSAHKLPYSNPFTGMCQPDEMKVSITGIPGRDAPLSSWPLNSSRSFTRVFAFTQWGKKVAFIFIFFFPPRPTRLRYRVVFLTRLHTPRGIELFNDRKCFGACRGVVRACSSSPLSVRVAISRDLGYDSSFGAFSTRNKVECRGEKYFVV